MINIRINTNENQLSKLEFINITGISVMEMQLNNTDSQIDISNLASGIYIVRLTNAKSTFQTRLVKK